MAECPEGRINRGTRSQFRLGVPGLGRGFYPINLGDVMDAGQSSQPNVPSSRDLISPSKGTRTLTVREYEQTISELKKENFDLKLKLFLFDEAMKKNSRKDKENFSPDQEVVQVVVQLTSEAESLRNELSYKDKLLQEALERAEKLELDFKELEKKCADLQTELASLSELPSKEKYLSLLHEKENLIEETDSLEKMLMEKDEKINEANHRIEILAEENNNLEDKLKKRSLAIQGFVYDKYREKELLPDELRNIVIHANQVAKKRNKKELALAVKNFSSALEQIMNASTLSASEEKENFKSPQEQCLKDGNLDRSSSSFLSCHSASSIEIGRTQSSKDVLTERNIPSTNQQKSSDSVVHDSFSRGSPVSDSVVNIPERDVMDDLNFSCVSPASGKNLISFSHSPNQKSSSVLEHNLTSVESLPTSPVPSESGKQDKSISKPGLSSFSGKSSGEYSEFVKVLKENEKLKQDLEEKLAIIENLQETCKELEVCLRDTESDALKASELHNVSTQTVIAGNKLLNEAEIAKLQKDAELSTNVEKLREDILLLLLTLEDKNQELSEVKETLSVVQDDLKKALNSSHALEKEFYHNERNDLHERLAFSCSINEELMRHLKDLEKFMESLLQDKFNSSQDSVSDKSGFLSNVTKCLTESLKLSNALSDNLSICEGSKFFEECESFVYKNGSSVEERSLPHLGLSSLSVSDHRASHEGPHIPEECIPYTQHGTEKARKESDSSQLCWRCWQQLNPPSNQSEFAHLMQNRVVPRFMGYPSSDSDIWSEPDRNVSMQRIGISLQNSPVASKSPRKSRQKDKRLCCRVSSEQDTSSNELQRASKKRQGPASRRLFAKESTKIQDCASEKFYSLLEERYLKIKSLLDELKSIRGERLSEEVWFRLKSIMASLEEARQGLQVAADNAKNFPSAVCQKCVMLELYADLKKSHKKEDFSSIDYFPEQEILRQISGEVSQLKVACKEPFHMLSESVEEKFQSADNCAAGKSTIKSQSTQSDASSENEKINELEKIIVNLNDKNVKLGKHLEETKKLLAEEKKTLESVETENLILSSQIDDLKNNLLNVKQDEEELLLKNEKLSEELTNINKNNSELTNALKDLEQKRQDSGIVLDELRADLEKNRTDLLNMSEKCLEYEKQLNEKTHMNDICESKLKNLELKSVDEKERYLKQIDDLNTERSGYLQELKNIKEQRNALEKENKSKNNELLSLQEIVKEQRITNENFDSHCKELQIQLKSMKEDSANLEKRCKMSEEAMVNFKENEEKYSQKLKHIKDKYLSEREELLGQISHLISERENILQKLENEREWYEKLKSEMAQLNENYAKSCREMSALERLNNELKSEHLHLTKRNESFENALLLSNNEADTLNSDLKSMKDTLQSLETKCLMYEKQLAASSGVKDNLIECLLNINDEFSVQRRKVDEVCKAYGSEVYVISDDCTFSDFVPVIDQDDVQKLCDNICSETKKLSQSVDMLLGLLQRCHLKSLESKTSEENSNTKIRMNHYKLEAENLKSENSQFRQIIESLQKSVSEKEKSTQFSDYVNQSLQQQLHNAEEETIRRNKLLESKDDEITELQERIFNLQTYINNIMTDKKLLEETPSMGERSIRISTTLTAPLFAKSILCDEETHDIGEYEKQLEHYKCEIEYLEAQNSQLRCAIEALQRTQPEKEKPSHFNAYEVHSLQEKLYHAEKEIEKGNMLLRQKDDKIAVLQEEIFNLQAYVNSVMADRTNLLQKPASVIERPVRDSGSSISQLLSKSIPLGSKSSQTREYEKQMENYKHEIEFLTTQNKQLKELQKPLQEKETPDHSFSYEYLQEKLQNLEKENERKNQLLEKKDDEINELQEKISDLQIFVDRKHSLEKHAIVDKNLAASDDQLPSKSVLKGDKACQTSECERQVEYYKREIEQLKAQNKHLQQESQKLILEKEKSIHSNSYEVKFLEEKLQNLEKDIDSKNKLLTRKDSDINVLRGEISDLHTYIESMKVDRKKLLEMVKKPAKEPVPSNPVSKDDRACQTNQYEKQIEHYKQEIEHLQAQNAQLQQEIKESQKDKSEKDLRETAVQSNDESILSASSHETGRNRCCEKFSKKCHSLQTKLSISKKHIEILEKEKQDLRESLLEQLQSKKDSVDKKDSASLRVAELESKLEMKKAFINDLKTDLLKTYNSVINKEKEIDDLKQKVAKCEDEMKHAISPELDRHSIPSPKSVDANIKALKSYKWGLMQTVFDIQRKFYEERGIHLSYFEKFKDHINNLFSSQHKQPLSKSESMPLLGSSVLDKQYEEEHESVKKLLDLEIDIGCLENLKIFLNRFLVPCVLRAPKTAAVQTSFKSRKMSSDRLTLPFEVEHEEALPEMPDVVNTGVFIADDHEDPMPEKASSFESVACAISQYVDRIEKLFISAGRCPFLDSLHSSPEDSADEVEVKSLLFKILQEMENVYKVARKMFSLNEHLKNFDVVMQPIHLSTSKQDVSDRESVMSEETIAVSRTESPLSFDGSCPIRLPHPETLELEEKTLKPQSVGVSTRVAVKTIAMGSSNDSVCHRSHYSSPDLGIESDPNHDSSAPEQKEDGVVKYQRQLVQEPNILAKSQQTSAFTKTESAGRWSEHKFGDSLFAIGTLPHYELLKQEVKESLVAIKSVLSRTGDGLHHIAKYTSPRKTLEYNTLRSIKDTCVHMEVCLKKANTLLGKFWTGPCPTEKEWKILNEENHSLSNQIAQLKALYQKQEREFRKETEKLEYAQIRHANAEKKISKKLVSTKKMIRQAELRLLETRCQNLPPVPKFYPEHSEQTS